MKGTLVVRRDADGDTKTRGLEVFVDGERHADLPFGKSLETDLDPGEHEVMVTNHDQAEKLALVLREGETAVFQGANVASGSSTTVTLQRLQ